MIYTWKIYNSSFELQEKITYDTESKECVSTDDIFYNERDRYGLPIGPKPVDALDVHFAVRMFYKGYKIETDYQIQQEHIDKPLPRGIAR